MPALVDHAASCSPQPPPPQSPTRRRSVDQAHAHSHAAAIARLVARAGSARGAQQQARLAVRCLCSRLDTASGQALAPLLQLLVGLLDCAAASASASAGDEQQQQGGRALAAAVVESGLLLEVLQALYARAAWHLPAAEMLAKLRSEF